MNCFTSGKCLCVFADIWLKVLLSLSGNQTQNGSKVNKYSLVVEYLLFMAQTWIETKHCVFTESESSFNGFIDVYYYVLPWKCVS